MSHPFNAHRTGEHHWDEAYPLLPAQYAELSRGDAASQPERRLMLAVLSDAIVLFQRRDPQRAGPVRQEFEEARRWILSNDSLWPYSFVNVCETLGIAYEPLRRALVAERQTQGAGFARPAARRRLLAGVTPEVLARTG